VKTFIRLSLQLMIVCYIGCVVAVEPLYTVALKSLRDGQEPKLFLLKYDFSKNTWNEFELAPNAYSGDVYVYNSRVYPKDARKLSPSGLR